MQGLGFGRTASEMVLRLKNSSPGAAQLFCYQDDPLLIMGEAHCSTVAAVNSPASCAPSVYRAVGIRLFICDQIVLFLEGPGKSAQIHSCVAGKDCLNFSGGLDS